MQICLSILQGRVGNELGQFMGPTYLTFITLLLNYGEMMDCQIENTTTKVFWCGDVCRLWTVVHRYV